MYAFMKAHWVAGAAFMAVALLALVPLLLRMAWPLPLLLLFLQLPAYMLHQVEEHAGDRFRTHINTVVCGGREGLRTLDVLWINIAGVWFIDGAALYAAVLVRPGWGLAAPYLMLVNAISHIGAAIALRGSNPGLLTAVFVFIPLSVATLATVPATLSDHVAALAIAIAIHAAIVVHLLRRLSTLSAAPA